MLSSPTAPPLVELKWLFHGVDIRHCCSVSKRYETLLGHLEQPRLSDNTVRVELSRQSGKTSEVSVAVPPVQLVFNPDVLYEALEVFGFEWEAQWEDTERSIIEAVSTASRADDWHFEADIHSPVLIFPADCENDAGPAVVVDFGHIRAEARHGRRKVHAAPRIESDIQQTGSLESSFIAVPDLDQKFTGATLHRGTHALHLAMNPLCRECANAAAMCALVATCYPQTRFLSRQSTCRS